MKNKQFSCPNFKITKGPPLRHRKSSQHLKYLQINLETDQGSGPHPISNFHYKYLMSGLWPTPSLQSYSTLKQTLSNLYQNYIQTTNQVHTLSSSLRNLQQELFRSEQKSAYIQKKLVQSQNALQEAMKLSALLLQEISNIQKQIPKHRKVTSNNF